MLNNNINKQENKIEFNNIYLYDDNNNINNHNYINDNCNYIYDKGNLNNGITGIFDGCINNSCVNPSYNSTFQGEKNNIKQKENIPLIENDINNSNIHLQIKYALKNMADLYSKSNPYFLKSKICNYYCGPFLDKDIFENKAELFIK